MSLNSKVQDTKAHLVVMAGGSGTRFWPKSTSKKPKQYLKFSGQPGAKTLIEETLERFQELVATDSQWILTTQALDQITQETLGKESKVRILAEPQGRNTAPCIYWAAKEIAKTDPKAVMMVMPSDHAIFNLDSFRETLSHAIQWAATHDDLVTLGIEPTRPETGYGYLKLDSAAVGGAASDPKTPVKLERFVEKPNLERAEEFLRSGGYLWNGGMFVWRVDVILREFARFMPEMDAAWNKADGQVNTAYPLMTATSIDYGILEKSQSVVTFRLTCGWDDLGSWTSLESMADRMGTRHEVGVLVEGQVVAVRSKNNVIDAPGKTVSLLDVEGMIIVQHGENLLVAKKESAQDLRLIVDSIKKMRPDLA